MIRRVFITLMFMAVSLFAINFQTASKEELMSIKGIGEKKAEAIMKYRRSHKIKSVADLKNVPGIGEVIADNAKRGIKNGDATKSIKAKKRSVKKSLSKSTDKKKSKSIKNLKDKKKKSLKKAKKVAGDKTKRAEKKAKKSLKKVRAKKSKSKK